MNYYECCGSDKDGLLLFSSIHTYTRTHTSSGAHVHHTLTLEYAQIQRQNSNIDRSLFFFWMWIECMSNTDALVHRLVWLEIQRVRGEHVYLAYIETHTFGFFRSFLFLSHFFFFSDSRFHIISSWCSLTRSLSLSIFLSHSVSIFLMNVYNWQPWPVFTSNELN